MQSINNYIMRTEWSVDMKQTTLEREFQKLLLYAPKPNFALRPVLLPYARGPHKSRTVAHWYAQKVAYLENAGNSTQTRLLPRQGTIGLCVIIVICNNVRNLTVVCSFCQSRSTYGELGLGKKRKRLCWPQQPTLIKIEIIKKKKI